MCKLISIQANNGTTVQVADIKAEIIKQIINIASLCKKIESIYVFGSSVEERCTNSSDIDIAIVSNVTRSKLFGAKDYNNFIEKLYDIDIDQEYDILQFNSLEKLRESKEYVCKDIMEKGVLIYTKEVS